MQQNPPLLPTLPMHLLLSMGCWLSSPFGLQCAKKGLLPLSLAANQSLKNLPEKALEAEAKNRASELLAGVLRYNETSYTRNVPEPPVIWSKGNAKILDYGQKVTNAKTVVLFIPSLINRYYVLDLEQDRSFVRFLAQQDIYPLVMDWGVPGQFEADFNCGDYITEILNPAIDFIHKTSGAKVALAGYCMGGVLALAAAQLRRSKIESLALFATPWDFYCPQFAPFVLGEQWLPEMEKMIDAQKTLSADIVQALFYLTDPFVFEQKFRRYSELDPSSRAAKDFVALEHWVNDGVPMTAGVARDALMGWAQNNALLKNQWVVDAKNINPKKIKLPTFMAIPQNDHVVPFECAIPLSMMMPHAQVTHPTAGHVGMIVGSRAKRELWQPYADWLHEQE